MATEQTTTAPVTTQAAAATNTTAAPAAVTQKTEAVAAKTTTTTEPAKTADPVKTPEKTTETILTGEKPLDPIKYELKLPKDSSLDAAYLAKIEAEAKAEGLTNEQAQNRLNRDNQLRAEVFSQQQTDMKTQSEKWVEQLKADKEFGGDNFKENVASAKRALDRFADPEFKKILDDTGLGNNPHLVRAFAKVGKLMGNDKLVSGSTGGLGKPSRESKLYPTMKQEE